MSDNTDNNSQVSYQRISFVEFFKISAWAFGLFYKIYPVKTIIWILTAVTDRTSPLLYTYIFARAVDELIKVAQTENASVTMMYPFLGWILAYNIVITLLNFVSRQIRYEIRQTSRSKIKQVFYTKLHSLGIETLEQPGVNDKISRAEYYLGNLMPFVNDNVQLIAIGINAITTGALLFSFMPILAPLIILSSLPYLFFDKHMRMKIFKVDYENTENRRKADWSAISLTNLTMLQEIITTGAFKMLDKKYIEFQDWINKIYVNLNLKNRIGSHSLGFLTDLLIMYGYVLIFSKLIAKTISVGTVMFWMRSLDIFQRALGDFTVYFNDQFELSIQLKDTYTLFMTKPVFKDGDIKLPKLDKGPKIDFVDVSFKYPRSDNFVLENLNLNIKAGEKLAIVGKNGAGKTTLTKLISRFYPVSNGEVKINDINVNNITAETLYQNMGILFQDFNNYQYLTARENISIGNPNTPANEIKIRTAAQTADAMDFINEFPNKFDQILDPRYKGGMRPSTGQWQKFAIARFFYRNAPLVIFDEPTASIDAVSEYNIFNKIYEFFEGKTVIIISHRFSTVRNADRIVVLDKGKIIEEGSHKELMALQGSYYEAFRLQAKGYSEGKD